MEDLNSLKASPSLLPCHVAIIMDGNGRWAKEKKMQRTSGHSEGLKRAKEIAKAASDVGIKYLTLYVFSTENWKRTQNEVGFLMNLIHKHLVQELDFYKANKIRVKVLGDRKGLPENIQKDILDCENDTQDFSGLTINLAINYGGRNEIIRSVKKIIKSKVSENDITEKTVSDNFDFPELPDVDLLIRTGGEKRLSNFLMWKSAYAELIFSPTLWPDYREDEFFSNLAEFKNRNRRFGAVPV